MYDTLNAAQKEQGTGYNIIDCVPQAVAEIFTSACDIKLDACDGLLEDATKPGLSATISLKGEEVNWTVYLGLPESTATQAVADFVGFEIPFDSADMEDAIGELANIVAGQVKVLLDCQRIHVELGLPAVNRHENLADFGKQNAVMSNHCLDSTAGRVWTGLTA